MRSAVWPCRALIAAAFALLLALPGWSTPDLLIRTTMETASLGDNLYNADGTGQTLAQAVPQRGLAIFVVTVQNDGAAAQTFHLSGTAGNTDWQVRYYNALVGGSEITTALTVSGMTSLLLNPGETQSIRAEVSPRISATAPYALAVTAATTSLPAASDTVKAALTTFVGPSEALLWRRTSYNGPVACSPDGALAAIAAGDGGVQLHRLYDGVPQRTLTGNPGTVTALTFSSDSQFLFAGVALPTNDGAVIIWRVSDGARLRVIPCGGTVRTLALAPNDQTVAFSASSVVYLHRVADGALLRTLTGHTTPIYALAYSPDGLVVAAGSANATIRLWNAADGTPRHTLTGHSGFISSLVFSPGGATLASTADDSAIRFWRVSDGQALTPLSTSSRPASLSYSADASEVIFRTHSGYTGVIRRVRLSDGAVLQTLNAFTKGILSLAPSANGLFYLAVGSNGQSTTVTCFPRVPGGAGWADTGAVPMVYDVAISPNSQKVASANADGTVKLWQTPDGTLLSTLSGFSSALSSVAFAPGGQYLAAGSGGSSTLRIWRTGDLGVHQSITAHASGIETITFSPDGLTVATGSTDETVKLWRVSDGQHLRTLAGHTHFIREVAFSPSGEYLGSVSADAKFKLWRVSTGECLYTTDEGDQALAVAFSPTQEIVAVGSGAGVASPIIRLRNVSDGSLIRTLSGHTRNIGALAFSPDGTELATASVDGSVKRWRVSTGECLDTLVGATDSLVALAFAPNARHIVTGGSDGLAAWTTGLTMPTPDLQPDLHIDNAEQGAPVGNNIYNLTGEDQTKTQGAYAGQTAVYDLTLENDGTGADTFTVVGDGGEVSAARTAGPVRVLAYLNGADTSFGGEYANTIAGINRYYTNYTLTTTTTTDPTTLATLLANADVFLVPELEMGSSVPYLTLGANFAPALRTFVEGGGLFIFCNQHVYEQAFLTGTGLFTLTEDYQWYGRPLVTTVEPTHPIMEGVPATFYGENATAEFTLADTDALVLATSRGKAVMAVRTVGLGHVVLIGVDYFQSNLDLDRIIANTVRWSETHAGTAEPAWTVTYQDAEGGDITTAVTGSGWTSPTVSAGGRTTLRLLVTPNAYVPLGDEKTVLVSAVSGGDPERGDTVRAVTTVPLPAVDACIRFTEDVAFLGDNIYNLTGENQEAEGIAVRPEPAVFLVKLQNDGLAPDRLRVTGTAAAGGWTMTYFSAPEGGTNITAQVTGDGWTSPLLGSGSEMLIRVEVTPGSGGMPIFTTVTAAVTVNSVSLPSVADTVLATATVVLAPKPDLLIRTSDDAASVGNNLWNTTGEGQTREGQWYGGHPATYLITLQNDGGASGDFRVTAEGAGDGWQVAVFDAETGGAEITGAVFGAGWTTPVIGAAGGFFPGVPIVIRAVVTPTGTAASGPYTLRVTAASRVEPVRVDTVQAVTTGLPLTAVTLAADPASPTFPGTPVTLHATPMGGVTVQYRFFARQGDGPFVSLCAYQPSATFTWTPDAVGPYTLLVWAREVGSTRTQDCFKTLPHQVNSSLAAVSLALQPAAVGPVGMPVTLRATPAGGSRVEVAFYRQPQGSAEWTLLRDFSQTLNYAWTPTTPGAYTLRAVAREAGATAPLVQDERPFTVLPKLTAVALAIAPLPHQQVERPVTLTATPTGGVNVTYRFFVKRTDETAYTALCAYQPSPTLTWTPTVHGSYTLLAWAREVGSTKTQDAFVTRAYRVTPTPLTGVTLSTDLPAPQTATTPLTLIAEAEGEGAEYRFFVQEPGSTAWTNLRAYGPSATCPWRPMTEGRHTLLVWARATGSAAAHEAYTTLAYQVAPAGSVRGLILTADRTSPQPLYSPITLSALNIGGACVQYRFQVAYPTTGGWVCENIRDYSTDPTCVWTPRLPGAFVVAVFARDTGNASPWQAYDLLAFRISGGTTHPSGPTAVTLTATPPSPQPLDTPVTVFAESVGADNVHYHFQYARPVGVEWQVTEGTGYSAISQRTWNLPAPGAYALAVFARTADSEVAWHVNEIITYRVTAP